MACLANKLYDPATAVNWGLSTLLPMTAFDTTNLRLSFTVPASGKVLVRIQCLVTGATTQPRIHLGILQSSTVMGRVAANVANPSSAAAEHTIREAVFVVSGLTPGASLTWDAAYGVESSTSSAAIFAGGPNDNLSSVGYGAFIYEIWEA